MGHMCSEFFHTCNIVLSTRSRSKVTWSYLLLVLVYGHP